MTKDLQKFLDRTEIAPGDNCWEWQAGKNAKGYGIFKHRWGTVAHRFIYELTYGKIQNQIDHLCRNRGCVNPSHLEDVTLRENIRRGESYNKNKTHCPQGHLLSGENLYLWKGRRCCRICRRESVRNYEAQRRLDNAPK